MKCHSAVSFFVYLANVHHSGRKKIKNDGFTLIELLLVVTILAVLLSTVVPGFTGFNQGANVAAARSAVASWRIKIDEYRTLHGEWPPELDKSWYIGHKYPRNPWLHERDARETGQSYNDNTDAVPSRIHPRAKTVEGWAVPFWYNPTNGEVRVRVPNQEDNDKSLEFYNLVNDTDASDYFQRDR